MERLRLLLSQVLFLIVVCQEVRNIPLYSCRYLKLELSWFYEPTKIYEKKNLLKVPRRSYTSLWWPWKIGDVLSLSFSLALSQITLPFIWDALGAYPCEQTFLIPVPPLSNPCHQRQYWSFWQRAITRSVGDAKDSWDQIKIHPGLENLSQCVRWCRGTHSIAKENAGGVGGSPYSTRICHAMLF